MHINAITDPTRATTFVPVNPVSAVPVDSGAGFVVSGLMPDGDPVLAGPGESNPYYTADHLTRTELVAAYYMTDRAELPTVAACPLREFEALAVEGVERIGIRHIREMADLIACPKLAESIRRNERLSQAEALAAAYFAVAEIVSETSYCDADEARALLGEWAAMVTAAAPVALLDALDALAERSSGVADRCDQVTGSAPLVSALGGTALAVAFYLGGVELPEAGVLVLDDYEDLARASVAGLGADSVRELVTGLRLWEVGSVSADWPDADRFEHAAALARDVADLVRAARYRKTVARFEDRL